MSKQSGGFFNYLVIVTFAVCIVALAGAELHKRYHGGKSHVVNRKGGATGQLVRDLHGDVGGSRASLSKATPGKEGGARVSREQPSTPTAAREKQSEKAPAATEKSADELGWSDRRQLNDLIDNLSP